MKELTLFSVLTFIFAYTAGQYGLWEEFKHRADVVHKYEYKSLELAKQIRIYKRENEELKSRLAQVQAEKEHLELNQKGSGRKIASIPKRKINDLVNFEVYNWTAGKLLGVGAQALHFKKFEKSAQYYNALLKHYPHHKVINDKVLFEAGIAAYESKKHYPWAAKHFQTLIDNYPRSKYRRGAKLWLGLTHFYQGNQQQFIQTVNEFRKKYRNTREWQVLSQYYEDLSHRYRK